MPTPSLEFWLLTRILEHKEMGNYRSKTDSKFLGFFSPGANWKRFFDKEDLKIFMLFYSFSPTIILENYHCSDVRIKYKVIHDKWLFCFAKTGQDA